MRRRLEGIDAIGSALDRGASLPIVLRRQGACSPEAQALLDRLRARGIEILEESEREMRRMSTCAVAPELVALEGPAPVSELDALMALDGPVLLLVALRYPANVGFILRSAEVAGVAGVAVAGDWQGAQREDALRVGMRANRFFSVVDTESRLAVAAARRAGRRLVAIETESGRAPWEVHLAGPAMFVVGGEAGGIPAGLLAAADERVTIPMRGFIPSYNVQAAVGVLLGEWLRQTTGS